MRHIAYGLHSTVQTEQLPRQHEIVKSATGTRGAHGESAGDRWYERSNSSAGTRHWGSVQAPATWGFVRAHATWGSARAHATRGPYEHTPLGVRTGTRCLCDYWAQHERGNCLSRYRVPGLRAGTLKPAQGDARRQGTYGITWGCTRVRPCTFLSKAAVALQHYAIDARSKGQ
jgi:hypothetical protein